MKISSINLDQRPQALPRGVWLCQVWFSVTTTRQFTDTSCLVEEVGRWWWLALWRGWRAARRYARANAAKPGERTAMGWAE